MNDPRKRLHVHTITVYKYTNDGYGDQYDTNGIEINDVYFEKSNTLVRGVMDVEEAHAWFSTFNKIDVKKGDKISYQDENYIVTTVEEFNKPFRSQFEHAEYTLKQSVQ